MKETAPEPQERWLKERFCSLRAGSRGCSAPSSSCWGYCWISPEDKIRHRGRAAGPAPASGADSTCNPSAPCWLRGARQAAVACLGQGFEPPRWSWGLCCEEKSRAPAGSARPPERKSGGRKAREEGRASAAPPASPPPRERILGERIFALHQRRQRGRTPPACPQGVTQPRAPPPAALCSPQSPHGALDSPEQPLPTSSHQPRMLQRIKIQADTLPEGPDRSLRAPLQAPSAPGRVSEPAAVPQQGCCEPPASHSLQTRRFCRAEPQAARRKSLTRNHLPGP